MNHLAESVVVVHATVRRRKFTRRLYRWWRVGQWLSVDVALGAMVSSAMACRALGISPLPWAQLLILGGTVQLIYTLDHLWDARRIGRPVTMRHWFHRRFGHWLIGLAIIQTALLAVVALVFLPEEVRRFGCWLAGLVGVYLLLVHALPKSAVRRWFPKELAVAGVYAAGIWGNPGVLVSVPPAYWLLAGVFGLLALQNLLVFSLYEQAQDLRQHQHSVVQTWGTGVTRGVLNCSWWLAAGMLFYWWRTNPPPVIRQVLLTEAVMSAGLLLIYAFSAFFRPHERYRWAGDAIFLLPVWSIWA